MVWRPKFIPCKSYLFCAYLSQRVMYEESEYVETSAITTLESQLEPFPEYSVWFSE